MKLAELEDQPSFALLGPGFGARHSCCFAIFVPPPAPTRCWCSHASKMLAPARSSWRQQRSGPAPSISTTIPSRSTWCWRLLTTPARWGRSASHSCGDVYQVCLTVRALVEQARGAELLSLMCRRGVPRFAAWVRLPDGSEFVSASPELLFETDGRQVHAEPMKGTASPSSSGVLEASEKDRAELAMITDLVRNDLAQVCRQKTIRVANQRRVLKLPYALQTVSDIVEFSTMGRQPSTYWPRYTPAAR